MDNSKLNYKFHYENWHADTEESKKSDMANDKCLLKAHNCYPMKTKKEGKILELGCGMGRTMLTLIEAGYSNVTGVDIDKSQIEIAKKENLNAHQSDCIEWLEKDTNTYDVIYCLDVLEHVEKEKQIKLLCEIEKHLNPNGMCVIRVPNALSPTANYFRYIDFTHTISHTEISLGSILKNANLPHCVFRPQYLEDKEVRTLKSSYARLLSKEHGLREQILTPNIMAIVFKNKQDKEEYLKTTPALINDYFEADGISQGFMNGCSKIRKFLLDIHIHRKMKQAYIRILGIKVSFARLLWSK